MARSPLILICVLFLFAGCKKNDNSPEPIPADKSFNVSINFKVDGLPLLFDSIIYSNDAGNHYGISNLQFYLTGFQFETNSGTMINTSDVIYVDAKLNTNTKFKLNNIPFGDYKRIKFFIGVDSAHNTTNGLPNTVTNMNMAWPSTMGGGYHFLKFEGDFIDLGNYYGYAMHLGKNQNIVSIDLIRNISINSTADTIKLSMNMNEWFRNPRLYDFNVDGNYTMGIDSVMSKLAANGADVFDN